MCFAGRGRHERCVLQGGGGMNVVFCRHERWGGGRHERCVLQGGMNGRGRHERCVLQGGGGMNVVFCRAGEA